jgi:4-hydroxybenzoate polyprenyltransferase
MVRMANEQDKKAEDIAGIKIVKDKMVVFASLIKFPHTVFALPFALSGMILATLKHPWKASQLFWIIMAMAGARTAAMSFNRLIDRKIDALNPRTQDRELIRGTVSLTEVYLLIISSSLLLIFSAYMLNQLCFYLSPLALLVVFFYSFVKRFSWSTHLFLGLALSIAPMGGWIAITGTFETMICLLSMGVLTWVAGFDILYSCQDYQFDLKHNIHSLPQRFGIKRALIIARGLHILTFIFLISLKFFFNLNFIYFIGVLIIGGILFYEHSLVKSNDLSKVNKAFFNMNGIISIAYLLFLLVSVA